jgi:anti-sigma B factor antagonist
VTFLEITTTTQDGLTMLAMNGRLDTTTAGDLEHEINNQIEKGNRKILLNFAATTYISSGGMRVLLATAKKLRNNGDRFGLCCLTPEVHKVLKLAGFTSLFSIYASEGEARAGLQ